MVYLKKVDFLFIILCSINYKNNTQYYFNFNFKIQVSLSNTYD